MKNASRQPDDQVFLDRYDASKYERLSVAVDVALFAIEDRNLLVLVVPRAQSPQKGFWALPGTFVGPDESLDDAAARALCAKAGQDRIFTEQLFTFGDPRRDPRTRVITVAYYALVASTRLRASPHAGAIALGRIRVPWKGQAGGPVEVTDVAGQSLPLAFDHAGIIGAAVKRIRGKLDYTPIGFQLLPPKFTLRDLQNVHEVVLGRRLNKDAFRRRVLATGQLMPTGKREDAVGHRPAELYRFRDRSAV